MTTKTKIQRQINFVALDPDHHQISIIIRDIADMHDYNPQLVDCLNMAAQLIVMGNVYNNGRVKSESSEEVYQTSFEGMPKSWFCTCADFDNGLQRLAGIVDYGGVDTDYGLMCSHSLAQLVAYFVGLDLPDEPIPF